MGHAAASLSEAFGRWIGEAFKVFRLLFLFKSLSCGICQKDKLYIEKDYAESHSVSNEVVT